MPMICNDTTGISSTRIAAAQRYPQEKIEQARPGYRQESG
jgi:hypothetical protein